MAKRIKLFTKRCIAKLFQVLGISSLFTAFGCTLINNHLGPVVMYGAPAMYGVPGNFFTLEGTVTDEAGNAINGIEVNIKSKENQTENPGATEYPQIEDQTQTDENGKFALYWNDMDKDNFEFILEIKDIDGELNGSFTDKTDSITFTQNEITGKTDFGNTKYKKSNKEIKLSKK